MASIGTETNGRKRILFVAGDGSRKTIRLGKASMKQADAFKVKVEDLVGASNGSGLMQDETARWLAALPDVPHERLAAVGLVKSRVGGKAVLGAFLADYIKSRVDAKPGTITNLGHTRRCLVEFFGEDKLLNEITEGDADTWRLNLIGQKLADATVNKRCGNAKQFFKAAVRRKLIPENPFTDLPSANLVNAGKVYFVTLDESRKVLDACPDAQWRLLFALSRYGALRCPSEHLGLKWGDINWEKGRFLVHSPKTEHHEGGESRWVPIFPELLPFLREVFEGAEPGTEQVITRYRDAGQNLRTQLLRIITRAGVKPWPKLWQNLRSTRETELIEKWPEHVVVKWVGHTSAVARKHYLQTTDEHFTKASAITLDGAARNPAQYRAESGGTAVNAGWTQSRETLVLQGNSSPCEMVREGGMGDKGFEPLTPSV